MYAKICSYACCECLKAKTMEIIMMIMMILISILSPLGKPECVYAFEYDFFSGNLHISRAINDSGYYVNLWEIRDMVMTMLNHTR